MIKRLELKNIALIKHAIIDFESGLNVLSGETGSGKSVIVDSINFVLGAKADKSMIRYGENECFASVVFDISNNETAKSILTELGTEFDDEIIVSRKFNSDSKSVIRVNGEPYTLGMLRQVTSTLVDVHGQSEHYSLTTKSEQLKVLDRFTTGSLTDLKAENSKIVRNLKEIDKALESFGGSEAERAIRADLLKYQIDEIESVDLQEGEEDDLIVKKKKIQSAEKISESLSAIKGAVQNDGCISDMLGEAIRRLNPINSIDEKYDSLYQRLKSISVELTDIADSAEDYLSEIDFDGNEADAIESRLDKIKNLKKKYGSSTAEIDLFLQNAKEEYLKLINFDAEYSALTEKKQSELKKLNSILNKITQERKNSALIFSEKVVEHLKDLGMKNSNFSILFKDKGDVLDRPYPENGNDDIDFAFSANLGEPLKPLSKIISGGEMSRFMLALKAIICEYQDISTYIFDEIDVGISGQTAEIVAKKFVDISKGVQVIAISHLPQICAFSDVSFLIEKHTENDKTFTTINKLDNIGKLNEIVRIIGGTKESSGAVMHATELIELSNAYKNK